MTPHCDTCAYFHLGRFGTIQCRRPRPDDPPDVDPETLIWPLTDPDNTCGGHDPALGHIERTHP